MLFLWKPAEPSHHASLVLVHMSTVTVRLMSATKLSVGDLIAFKAKYHVRDSYRVGGGGGGRRGTSPF